MLWRTALGNGSLTRGAEANRSVSDCGNQKKGTSLINSRTLQARKKSWGCGRVLSEERLAGGWLVDGQFFERTEPIEAKNTLGSAEQKLASTGDSF